jgi:hypothetical protein
MTTAEAAAFLRVRPKTFRNKVAAGVFAEGIHFFRRAGLCLRRERHGTSPVRPKEEPVFAGSRGTFHGGQPSSVIVSEGFLVRLSLPQNQLSAANGQNRTQP